MWDWTLRAKLTAAFLAVAITSGVITTLAGSYLFKTNVMREALRRVEPRYHGLKLRQAAEAVAVVMLSEEPDLKREAADEAWQMLTGFDWAQLGDARIWDCLDLGYWWGVAAGVFPGS